MVPAVRYKILEQQVQILLPSTIEETSLQELRSKTHHSAWGLIEVEASSIFKLAHGSITKW